MPVAEHYQAQGLCVRISAVPPPDVVFTEVCLRMLIPVLCLSEDTVKPVRSMLTVPELRLHFLLWQKACAGYLSLLGF